MTSPPRSIEQSLSDISNELQNLNKNLIAVQSFGSIRVESPEQIESRLKKSFDDTD